MIAYTCYLTFSIFAARAGEMVSAINSSYSMMTTSGVVLVVEEDICVLFRIAVLEAQQKTLRSSSSSRKGDTMGNTNDVFNT